MKKINFILLAAFIIIALTACRQGKHVVIQNDNNGVLTRMSYYGKIAFADDNMSIKSMSPDSYIEFKMDGEKLIAQRENGSIIYELSDGTKTNTLSEDNKHFIASVLKRVGKFNNR
ncbi:hypothetical protein BDD43_4076 [Mucilaginibacter gracilis]|uniref:Lipoprotein n=1 Tax=Mucilaginibacter gracilis TaxID=423350 RepID=A0A495J572_9SPHI|nr:hypothetical protein [Mucilaginibacter gracilis]RKR83861.1 hypothetical protein BDD43_4076 [Mucilaginibacter gracilis]